MWQSCKERFGTLMGYSAKIEFVKNDETKYIHFLCADCFYSDEFQKKLNLSDKKQEIDFNKLFTTLEQTLENWVKSEDTKLVSKSYYNNRYCNELLNMTPYFTSRDAETSDEPLEENIIKPITNFTSTLKLAVINMPVFEIYNLIDSLDKCNLFVKHGIRNYYKPELRDGVKCYIWAN